MNADFKQEATEEAENSEIIANDAECANGEYIKCSRRRQEALTEGMKGEEF